MYEKKIGEFSGYVKYVKGKLCTLKYSGTRRTGEVVEQFCACTQSLTCARVWFTRLAYANGICRQVMR